MVKSVDGRDALEGSAALNAAAGGIASGTLLVVLFPIDVLKTHLQTAAFERGSLTRVLLPRMYSGMAPAVLEHSANRYMLFGISTMLRDRIPPHWPEPVRDGASGFGAAFTKTVCLHPMDTIKCRWQLGQPRSNLSGLYNGLGAAVTRSAGGMAIWLALRNHLERTLPQEAAGAWASTLPQGLGRFLMSDAARHFVCGALASMVTDLFTFPLDTLKKNMQVAQH
jgi:hypothetical protein